MGVNLVEGLTGMGLTASTVRSGQEALELIGRHEFEPPRAYRQRDELASFGARRASARGALEHHRQGHRSGTETRAENLLQLSEETSELLRVLANKGGLEILVGEEQTTLPENGDSERRAYGRITVRDQGPGIVFLPR